MGILHHHLTRLPPLNSCKTARGVPAWTYQLAQVCLRSWKRKLSIPDSLTALSNDSPTVVIGISPIHPKIQKQDRNQ